MTYKKINDVVFLLEQHIKILRLENEKLYNTYNKFLLCKYLCNTANWTNLDYYIDIINILKETI
jgi:hypothetical protein